MSYKYELFLRNAQTPDHLQIICDEVELAPLVLPILEQTKQRCGELWRAHARKHAKSTAEMNGAIAGLGSFYGCASPQSATPGFLGGRRFGQ
jgi:hypothetical protein